MPQCVYEYNEPEEDSVSPAHKATDVFRITAKDAGEIVFGVGHMHSGAINVTMELNGKFVCASYPVYGTVCCTVYCSLCYALCYPVYGTVSLWEKHGS
jgi:hypothetical protein